MIKFTWDNQKSKSNIEKHGVSFDEAKTVFNDEMALQYFDNINADNEDRFIMLGLSAMLRLLVVVYCERGEGDVIRIISARKATKNESKNYGK